MNKIIKYDSELIKEYIGNENDHIEITFLGTMTMKLKKDSVTNKLNIEFIAIGNSDQVDEAYNSRVIYDLIPGLDFLEAVLAGNLINYDGSISGIYIDGYISNVGLATENGFLKGNFLVDENLFKEICEEHEVYVNWENK